MGFGFWGLKFNQLIKFLPQSEITSDFYFLQEISITSDVYGRRAAYLKTKEMQGKVSIFSSGKMISVGTKKFSCCGLSLNLRTTQRALMIVILV